MPNKLLPALIVLAPLLLNSCAPAAEPVPAADIAALHRWLDSQRSTPADLLGHEIGSGRSAVLVQGDVLRGDTFDLVQSLLPTLYDLGIRNMGVYFLDSADQESIDNYITSGSPDTDPQELLFSANASLGYREYLNFMEYVRSFNARIPQREDGMKLTALARGGKADADLIASLAVGEPAEGTGLPAAGESAGGPVFLWINGGEDGFPFAPSDSEASGPAILVHHGPSAGELPLNGLIETATMERPLRDRTFAYRPGTPPFGRDDPDIVIVTAFPYRAVEPIPEFITPENVDSALRFFPEFMPRDPGAFAASRLNRIMRRSARRYASELKSQVPEGWEEGLPSPGWGN